jgi:hypothetical protein
MDCRVKPGNDKINFGSAHTFSFSRFAAESCCPPKYEGGGDAGRIPSPTAACAKEKSTDEVVTAKAGMFPGVPHSALGGLFRECRKRHARSPFAPLRTVELRLTSCGPRWTPSYPPLADLLGFAFAHWHALARSRQGRPCDERNGSPEPRDFSRREPGCVTPEACGHRSRSAHRTRRATCPVSGSRQTGI